jgi:hypothetical protein
MKMFRSLAFCSLAASNLPFISASDVLVLGSVEKLLHASSTSKDVFFSSAGLAELALDSFGLPTGNVFSLSESVELVDPPSKNPVQADVFSHTDAFVMVFLDDFSASTLEKIHLDIPFSKVFQSRGSNMKKVANVVATELLQKYGSNVAVNCAGSSSVCYGALKENEVDPDNLKATIEQYSFLKYENKAEFALVKELASVGALASKNQNADTHRDLYVLNFSSLKKIEEEKRIQASQAVLKQVNHFLSDISKQYNNFGAFIATTNEAHQTGFDSKNQILSYSRMLLSGSSNSSSNSILGNHTSIDGPSMEEIAQYQIILWTSVLLAATLFLTILSLCNLNTGRDSLLFAKFITDPSHRKAD